MCLHYGTDDVIDSVAILLLVIRLVGSAGREHVRADSTAQRQKKEPEISPSSEIVRPWQRVTDLGVLPP